jgi:hypothetical protein
VLEQIFELVVDEPGSPPTHPGPKCFTDEQFEVFDVVNRDDARQHPSVHAGQVATSSAVILPSRPVSARVTEAVFLAAAHAMSTATPSEPHSQIATSVSSTVTSSRPATADGRLSTPRPSMRSRSR